MQIKFRYQDREGSVEVDRMGQVKGLKFDGNEATRDKNMFTVGEMVFTVKKDTVVFPYLMVGEDRIELLDLSTTDKLFVALPLASTILALGGAVPIIISIFGIMLNVGFFMDPSKSKGMKIGFSIVNTLIGLGIVLFLGVLIAILLG